MLSFTRAIVATILIISGSWCFAAKPGLTESEQVIVSSTHELLKKGKIEIDKLTPSMSLEQKLALKKIAFNTEADLQVRWKALVLAARLLGADLRAEISNAAASNEWFMRSAAMMAASEISPDEAALLARRLVKDKALVVRSAAVEILGSTGEPTDRDLLWGIIRDPVNVRKGQSLWIRSQALQILARRPTKNDIPRFIELLGESDLELQAISIHALEKASDFQFGSSQDSIKEHRVRWLNWWELTRKTKSL